MIDRGWRWIGSDPYLSAANATIVPTRPRRNRPAGAVAADSGSTTAIYSALTPGAAAMLARTSASSAAAERSPARHADSAARRPLLNASACCRSAGLRYALRLLSARPSGSRTVGTIAELDRPVEVPEHAPHQRHLLDVLLPEADDVGLGQVEQLGDDGEHAGEMARSRRTLPSLRRLRRPRRGSRRRAGTSLSTDGTNSRSTPRAGDERPVPGQVARIAIQVFGGTELKRVDEDAQDDGVRAAARLVHEREMPLVQMAHRRHEADPPARARCAAPTRAAAGSTTVSCIGPPALVETVFGTRIATVAHVVGIEARRRADLVGELREPPEELRVERLVEAEHVVQDEDLSVARRARADADGGNREGLGDPLGQRRPGSARAPIPKAPASSRSRASSSIRSAAAASRPCTR